MVLKIKSPHHDIVVYTFGWFKRKFLSFRNDYTLQIQGVKWRNRAYGECLWLNDTSRCVIKYDVCQKLSEVHYTLLHELWHFKQFLEYKLIHLVDDKWMWRGSIRETSCNWAPPWEKEARRYEQMLGDELLADKKFVKILSKNSSRLHL